MTKPTLWECIARAKREVIADVLSGRVDADCVRSFSDLHDYVDANDYGGAFELWQEGDAALEENNRFWNAVQDAVHAWIASGQMRREAIWADEDRQGKPSPVISVHASVEDEEGGSDGAYSLIGAWDALTFAKELAETFRVGWGLGNARGRVTLHLHITRGVHEDFEDFAKQSPQTFPMAPNL